MTRNNADFQGGSGHHITDEPDAEFFDPEEKGRRLTLHVNGTPAAVLHYHTDPVGVAYIDLVRSNNEGQGHASKLIDHLYNKYPRHDIDWGEIQHPAASHLYQKFSNRYGRSHSWDDEQDGW